MADFPYLIASFPDLLLDFERHDFDEASVVEEVKERLSEKDRKLVDWLEFGLDGSNLGGHFYRAIAATRNRFLKEFFDFDRRLRLAKVAHLEGKPLEEEFYEYDKAQIIFNVENIFDREKLLDRLIWNKAAELAAFDVFNIDQLLSMLVRLHIIARWNRLDPSEGAQLFKQLVDEVRGTFKGINAEQI